MLIERWRRPSLLSSMRQHVRRLQFDSCAKKDSLCGTVMIHDGLNLRCLDQCHGVSSDGTSSSQSWRKRSVMRQSEFDPWVYTSLHPCFKPTWFMQVCLGKPSCEIRQRYTLDICASNSQDSPKASPRVIFNWKNFIEQLKNECWLKGGEGPVCWVQCAKMWQDCSLTAVQKKTSSFEFPLQKGVTCVLYRMVSGADM